ncbi:MurR/RpiR family transcriptional regulator [Cohaesibacter gelatinilyticus]|uniref:Transcriptional regulator, RpiR family n=1 Tax=Cohaesibacter gelatinilyticus TaxID=372072 RepID=A0A285PIE9_9HYPH|nr:MurR/RpiR family transcriptional regulator [Cohaesibacter gelatinilyticus]SNZ21495.1 transcriptional regulator, RpiR family [Cohaesibacter gelatinilyticus]
MSDRSKTIAELLRNNFDDLTRAERQLANCLLENYPVSGLGSITTLAENAKVSTPTVARMVQKLGFKGYPEFQACLHSELEAKISDPIAKHDRWSEAAPDTHILNRFADSVMQNMRQTLAQIDVDDFDNAANLLADTKRSVHIVGGRISRALADYFFTHMQVIRQDVTLIASNSNAWPHYVLNMKEGDVLVIFDIRRYERDIRKLAQMARDRGVQVILFTDQWSSPVSEVADYCFNCRIEVPSAWDSSVVIMFVIETMIAAVQTENWGDTKDRMQVLEALFDETRLFRKFV